MMSRLALLSMSSCAKTCLNISVHSFKCSNSRTFNTLNRLKINYNLIDSKLIFVSKYNFNPLLNYLRRFEKKSSVINFEFFNNYSTKRETIDVSGQTSKHLDSEELEKEKQRVRQQKMTKYTLFVMLCLMSGSAIYALFEWGKPSVDENGNPIEDRFSDLPIIMQYIYRAWDTFTHYEQVLREPTRLLLLPPPLEPPYFQPPLTLVLEMTGVLVHPEWTYKTGWRFKKRPFIDYFLQQCATSTNFEIVIYTYEQGFTAFPLIDSLDPNGFIMYRLFRDSTRYENGTHLKDLNCLNRDLSKVIHIDWNKKSCDTNPNNCLILKKWDGNSDDRTLYDLAQFLRAIASEKIEDVRDVVHHYSQFDDPLEAFKENQRKLAEQQQELDKQNVKPPALPITIFNRWKQK